MDRGDKVNDFYEWLEKAGEVLHNAQVATALIRCKSSAKDEVADVHEMLNNVVDRTSEAKQVLQKWKQLNTQSCKLISLLKALDDKIIHMIENIPPKLIQDYQHCNKQPNPNGHKEPSSAAKSRAVNSSIKKKKACTDSTVDYHETELKDCKKVLFSEPELCPLIPLLSEEEFRNLPKYIIGRQPLETVNSLIDTLNMILESKYTLLALGKNDARKKGELDLYLHYKKQQTTVCEGTDMMYFFNADDYHRLTKLKLDKTKLNLLTALRHCKRLREFRQGKDLQYVVIPS